MSGLSVLKLWGKKPKKEVEKMDIPKHLIIALAELGQQEIEGEEDNPRISEYLNSVNLGADDEIPWCAAFVNWCLEKSGAAGTKKANAKSYLNWGYHIADPIPGCVCVFDRGTQKWQGHVGFYLDSDDNYIYLLGGNHGNKVSIRRYRIDKFLTARWSSEFV